MDFFEPSYASTELVKNRFGVFLALPEEKIKKYIGKKVKVACPDGSIYQTKFSSFYRNNERGGINKYIRRYLI